MMTGMPGETGIHRTPETGGSAVSRSGFSTNLLTLPAAPRYGAQATEAQMLHSRNRRHIVLVPATLAGTMLAALLLLLVARDPARVASAKEPAPDPWTPSDVLQPADLAKLISDPKTKKPLILCVGFDFLYRQAHIPGAEYRGPAGKPEGLDKLKQRVASLPRSQSIVLYCGCCPWTHCPNIRPAFSTLHEMGFTRVKVLSLPTDFATDWVHKGYPLANPPHP